jgi:hydrogenase maturation protease
MTRPAILIAGIGNIFLGDDAFGSEVVRRLGELHGIEGVEIFDFGIRGLDLAYALADRCDIAILVDATAQNSPPGTLHLLELDLDADGGADNQPAQLVDAHSMDPMKVLRLVRSMNGRVRRAVLVGCEPADLGSDDEGRMGLSEVVEAAVPQAIVMVKELVAGLLAQERESRLTTAGKDG